MNITINQPQALHELGKRGNNEDNILPAKGKATTAQNLFLVCDGVGGAAKGEEASALLCAYFDHFFKDKKDSSSDETTVREAFANAEREFDNYFKKSPESYGMATTFTFLHLHEGGATVAHAGDSRVYQLRNGRVLFCTTDHSHVNDMVKAGVLTPEQAIGHPQRNIITRAVQGTHKRTLPDVAILTDIQAGDYFFLCTDGILESVSDEMLAQITATNTSDAQKIQAIQAICNDNSRDNFSCYLVPIKTAEGAAVIDAIDAELAADAENTVLPAPDDTAKNKKAIAWFSKEQPQALVEETPKPPKKSIVLPLLLGLVGVLALAVGGAWFYQDSKKSVEQEESAIAKAKAKKDSLAKADSLANAKADSKKAKDFGSIKDAEKEAAKKKNKAGGSKNTAAVTGKSGQKPVTGREVKTQLSEGTESSATPTGKKENQAAAAAKLVLDKAAKDKAAADKAAKDNAAKDTSNVAN